MGPRSPCLGATDYVFFLRKHVDKFGSNNPSDEEDETSSEFETMRRIKDSREVLDDGDLPKLCELLRNLSEDLKAAPTGFVDDFVYEPNNGIFLLMDILRSSLNQQQCPGMVFSESKELNKLHANSGIKHSQAGNNKNMKTKDRQFALKQAMTDEYYCLCSLQTAARRNPQSFTRMIVHKNGLSTVASCIVSNLTKSRLIALQLLTSACNFEPDGSIKVLEAMSVMRIVFGESVRFKLLTSVLMNSTLSGLETSALTLINSILCKAPNVAEQIRLQCEFQESGFDMKLLEKKMKPMADDENWSKELNKWKEMFVDVIKLHREKRKISHQLTDLKLEVDSLKKSLSKLETEKLNMIHTERELKEKLDGFEREVKYLKKLSSSSRLASSGIQTSVNMRRYHKNNRQASDSSDQMTGTLTVDSGRWSDNSSGDLPRKSKSDDSDEPISFEQQQDVSEDVLIYVPLKTKPQDIPNALKVEQQDTKDHELLSSSSSSSIGLPPPPSFASKSAAPECSGHRYIKRREGGGNNTLDPLDSSRWKLRQRKLSSQSSSPTEGEHGDIESVRKPAVVQVIPKKSHSSSALHHESDESTNGEGNVILKSVKSLREVKKSLGISKSTSRINVRSLLNDSRETLSTDELDYFSWVHPIEQQFSDSKETKNNESKDHKMNEISEAQKSICKKFPAPSSFGDKFESSVGEGSNFQLFASQALQSKQVVSHETAMTPKSPLPSSPTLKKVSSVKNSLQSYFFSGTISSKKSPERITKQEKENPSAKDEIAVPKELKQQQQQNVNPKFKGFFNSSHSNCGLYSGNSAQGGKSGSETRIEGKKGKDKNVEDEVQIKILKPSSQVKSSNALTTGRMIPMTKSSRVSVKDIGAWL